MCPRHWGTASENEKVKEFWVRRHCQTQPKSMGPPPPTTELRFLKPANWGGFGYFYEVHSRWYACYLHYADVKSGNSVVSPTLPIIDDEYNEQVAVYQSVLRAKERFVMAELGCRWGTWGTRSLAMLRHARPEIAANVVPGDVLLVESRADHCRGVETVLEANNMTGDATLLCEPATNKNIRAWAADKPHIDLLDIDIQGYEAELVPAELIDLFNEKTFRLIIGTHSGDIHEQLVELLTRHRWHFIANIPTQPASFGITNYVRAVPQRRNPKMQWPKKPPYWANWKELLELKPKQ